MAKTKNVDTRRLNEDYRKMAQELIDSEKVLSSVKSSGVRIAYLESDLCKRSGTKIVYGQCERVSEKNKWAINYDFTITLFKPNLIGFDRDAVKRVLLHELLHVEVKEDLVGITYAVRPHDIEDFRYVLERYGFDYLPSPFEPDKDMNDEDDWGDAA